MVKLEKCIKVYKNNIFGLNVLKFVGSFRRLFFFFLEYG